MERQPLPPEDGPGTRPIAASELEVDDYDEGDHCGSFRSRRDQLWSCCDVQAVESY